MKKTLKNIFAAVIGALCGAVGLSALVFLLFWGINSQSRAIVTGYFFIAFFFTVPLGGLIGAIISVAWFSEKSF